MDFIQSVSPSREAQRQYALSLTSNDQIVADLKHIYGTVEDFYRIVSSVSSWNLKSSTQFLEYHTTSYYLLILAAGHPLASKGYKILGLIKSHARILPATVPFIQALWDKPTHVLKLLNFAMSEILFLAEVLEQAISLKQTSSADSYRGFVESHAAARLRWHAFPMRDYKELVDCWPRIDSLLSQLATQGQGDHLRGLSNLANSHTVREVLDMASVASMRGAIQKTAVTIRLPYLRVAILYQLLSRISGRSAGMGSEDVIISFFKRIGGGTDTWVLLCDQQRRLLGSKL